MTRNVTRWSLAGVAFLCLLLGMPPAAWAQEQEEPATDEPEGVGLRRDPDEQGDGRRFGDSLIVGGRLRFILTEVRTPRRDEGSTSLRSGAQVQASWAPRAWFEGFTKVEALRDERRPSSSGLWAGESDLRVREAFVLLRRGGRAPIAVQLGRQRIRDTRDWFYDEYMDAARVRVRAVGWRFEGLFAESLFAGPEADRLRREKRHLVFAASKQIPDRARIETFVIARNDRSVRNEDPTWIGGSIMSRTPTPTRLWYTGALRRGSSAAGALRGWAMEAGARRRMPDWKFRPAFTVSYARASGDDRVGDGVDHTFRQTGLELNMDSMGGRRWFNYYGVLFQPELSNIHIATGAVTIRPLRRASLSFVYHRYQQVTPAPSATNALDARASGVSGHLGDEWDVVVSKRFGEWTEVDVQAGVFRMGAAYTTRSTAFQIRPQVRVYF